MDYKEQIADLLKQPEKLKMKKPFVRGAKREMRTSVSGHTTVNVAQTIPAQLPNYNYQIISQEQFMRELDPNCHDVLFDDNIPSICVKVKDGGYQDITFEKMAIPFQRNIKDKQVMHLTALPMEFTLIDIEPSQSQQDNFILFKQYWKLRNQDGMKAKMVDTQKSLGDAGLLYYFDNEGHIKSRILSFADGFVLCPHNDQNGDRILESVYYMKDNVEYIDSYDNQYMYRYVLDHLAEDENGSMWRMQEPVLHGFNEIPLITKRGDVAWNNVQPIINCYEELYNVFNAIQKRWGWGIFYVKGRFKDDGRKIAGSVVLNDTSLEGNGDAKFLTPPTPQGTIETLKLMFDSIQLGSSTTFLLPQDVKMSGDISGLAIQLTQSLDIENATQAVIEWQNVADKMVRLFKHGLAKELVNYGIMPKANTEFEDLNISAHFQVWKPMNDYEYNNMLTVLTGAGILSKESGIELNTVSKPDEKMRVKREENEAAEKIVQTQINTVENGNGLE